jgi:hypothetical protein
MPVKKKPPAGSKKKPGPEAETVKLKGNWKKNVKTALAKPRPKEGWPKE